MCQEVKKIRKGIDKIDKKLKEFLGKREELVKEIGKLKKKYNLEIKDKNREKEILSDIKSPFVKKVFKKIIESSKSLQSRL